MSGSATARQSSTAGVVGQTTLRVELKEPIADGVCRLRLVDPHGERLADWSAGAHIDLGLANGMTRQYSLCGDRWDPYGYEIAVLYEPNGKGGSRFIHDCLAVGDLVEVGGPRNHFRLVPAMRYLFIAGGIGITPIVPMVEHAEKLETPWTLLYGGRRMESMAYLDRLREWGERVVLRPQDSYGHLDIADAVDAVTEGMKIYCCGPPPLLEAVERACVGLPTGILRVERFVANTQRPPVRSATYQVELARSGTTLTLSPEQSVLDALVNAGVPILASCRHGLCGTCETKVIAGVPDHRDSILDDAERALCDRFYPCVSRSASDRLVVDL
ncbi:PDR/VanB family oxidoreductase [Mycobacterium colombiense]|uniref:PDR/VanB family oxidoreductase n=1 Tax=Mycobacterium colombiense TaxID=339268 RepID=UPI00200B4E5B|nr:PDR/VanB family oxidoreductase [Mycobacterium colombiense]MCK8647115.1 PDR/VanB family oxidoreductase [Mycobacterium colombiense]